jgi:dTDP-4-amino-4,6-dideoxygalactose transaminase
LALTKLSDKISELINVKYTLLTSSGTAALVTALKSSKIPLGAEVIMPSICCPAVLFAIQWAGYSPILADINLNDYGLDVDTIKQQLTAKTAAIVAVHNYGHYCQIDAISDYCHENNLVLIEDACLAMGGSYKGKPLGSYGDFSIVSFGYDKIIDCQYGGGLLTNNEQYNLIAQNFLAENQFFTFNNQLESSTNIINKLAHITSSVSTRIENTKLCDELLQTDNVIKLPFKSDVLYWRYPLLIPQDREGLINSAKQQGIILPTHYKSLHHLSTGVFRKNANYLSEHIINIFILHETSKDELVKTIKFINGYYS